MSKLFGFIIIILTMTSHFGHAQNAEDIVIPRPNSVVMQEGTILLEKFASISEKNALNVSKYLKSTIEDMFDLKVKQRASSVEIALVVDENFDIKDEGYILDITTKNISINASTESGAFYGVQSLLQLMRAGENGGKIMMSNQKISDVPSFSWRSYMLDESRHFLGEEEVYRLLDAIAELKMNVFHWHLTDDAGWRIEIKKYPLLTEIGSKRSDTQVGGWNSDKRSGVPHEGFYTQKQIKRVLEYAKARYIKVVPEIEMPGHACAAIAAYPWLGTKNVAIEVPAEFGKHYHTYDVIDPRVKKFMHDVVTEVIDLFQTDVIHIGGDEVRFNHWEEDKDMVEYKRMKNFNSFMDIQIEFTNDMSRFIESKGCRMMGWNEILGKNLHTDDNIEFEDTSTKIAQNIIVQFWKGDLKELVSAAKQGYKMVNSHHVSTYLDDTHESIPLKKAYDFEPIPKGLDAQYHDNIIGLGCQMWREWAPTVERVHEQTFPRIAAFAEVGWSDSDIKDYDNFVMRLNPIIKEWEKRGIKGYNAK